MGIGINDGDRNNTGASLAPAVLREQPGTDLGEKCPKKRGWPLAPAFCDPLQPLASLLPRIEEKMAFSPWNSPGRVVGLVLAYKAVRKSRTELDGLEKTA